MTETPHNDTPPQKYAPHAWPTLAVIPWERQVVKRFFRGIERKLDGLDPGPDPLLLFDKRR